MIWPPAVATLARNSTLNYAPRGLAARHARGPFPAPVAGLDHETREMDVRLIVKTRPGAGRALSANGYRRSMVMIFETYICVSR